MSYQKKGNDVKFRRVSLKSELIPFFENFESNTVKYQPDCVLEIQKTDGTTVIEYEYGHFSKIVLRDGKFIKLPKDVPTHRLWVCDREKRGIAYKIPCELEIREENQLLEIPKGSDAVKVFGDKYFSAVYDLINP